MAEPMTSLDLDCLEQLASAARPREADGLPDVGLADRQEALMLAAREAVPALVAEVRRLRVTAGRLRRLEQEVVAAKAIARAEAAEARVAALRLLLVDALPSVSAAYRIMADLVCDHEPDDCFCSEESRLNVLLQRIDAALAPPEPR